MQPLHTHTHTHIPTDTLTLQFLSEGYAAGVGQTNRATSHLSAWHTPPPLTSAENRTRKWLFQELISTHDGGRSQLAQHVWLPPTDAPLPTSAELHGMCWTWCLCLKLMWDHWNGRWSAAFASEGETNWIKHDACILQKLGFVSFVHTVVIGCHHVSVFFKQTASESPAKQA